MPDANTIEAIQAILARNQGASPTKRLGRLMGGWQKVPKKNSARNAQNFAARRLALMQAALQQGFGIGTELNPANSAWADTFNSLNELLASPQIGNSTSREGQYRNASALFSRLSQQMGMQDPRQFLLALLGGQPQQFNPSGY